jgi:hypothetical protein
MDNSHAVKLILTYDIRPNVQDQYFQFMLGEMVPTLQAQGLHMNGAWHTAYGNYPMRLVEFVAEDRDTLDSVMSSSAWDELEARLRQYVENYSRKTVPLREDMFQF